MALVRHEVADTIRNRPVAEPRRGGARIGPARMITERASDVTARVVQYVTERVAGIERVGEKTRTVAVGKDPSRPPHGSIQRTSQPNFKPLHTARKGHRIFRF